MIAVTNLQYGWTLFVVLGGIAFFAWGETASLFPAICTASLLIPLASFDGAESGSWRDMFLAAAALFNILAAFLVLAALKPLRLPATPR